MNTSKYNQLTRMFTGLLLSCVALFASSESESYHSLCCELENSNIDLPISRLQCFTPIYRHQEIDALAQIKETLTNIAAHDESHKDYIRNVLFQPMHPIHHQDITPGFEKYLPQDSDILRHTIHYLLLTRAHDICDLLELNVPHIVFPVIFEHIESDVSTRELCRFIKRTNTKKIFDILSSITELDERNELLQKNTPYVKALIHRLNQFIMLNVKNDFLYDPEDRRQYLKMFYHIPASIVDIILMSLEEDKIKESTISTPTTEYQLSNSQEISTPVFSLTPRILLF